VSLKRFPEGVGRNWLFHAMGLGSKGKKGNAHLMTNQGMNCNCTIRHRYIRFQERNFCPTVLKPMV
jgi:hypothetical protein